MKTRAQSLLYFFGLTLAMGGCASPLGESTETKDPANPLAIYQEDDFEYPCGASKEPAPYVTLTGPCGGGNSPMTPHPPENLEIVPYLVDGKGDRELYLTWDFLSYEKPIEFIIKRKRLTTEEKASYH